MDKFTDDFIGVSPLYKDQTTLKISKVFNYNGYVWETKSVSLGKDLIETLYSCYEKLDTLVDIKDGLNKELEHLYLKEEPNSVLIQAKLDILDSLLKEHEVLESVNIPKDVILEGLKSEHLYEDYLRTQFSFQVVVREGYQDYRLETEIEVTRELLDEIKEDLAFFVNYNLFFKYSVEYRNKLLTLHVSYVFKDIAEDGFEEHVAFLKKIVSIKESRVN